MIKGKVIIRNLTGLHLRPAERLCEEARKFSSHITFQKGNHVADAKSLLSVLGSGTRSGDEIEFTCEGADEEKALKALIALVESGLGE